MKEAEEIELEDEVISALQRIFAKHRIPAANVALQLLRPPVTFPIATPAAAPAGKDERETSNLELSPNYHHPYPYPQPPAAHRPASANHAGRPGSSSSSAALGSGSAPPAATVTPEGAIAADHSTYPALTYLSSFSSANFTTPAGTAAATPMAGSSAVDAFPPQHDHDHDHDHDHSSAARPSSTASGLSRTSGGGATHSPRSGATREDEDSFLQDGAGEVEPLVRLEVQFVRHQRELAHPLLPGWTPRPSAAHPKTGSSSPAPFADASFEDGAAGTVLPPGILSARPSSQQQVNSPMSAVSITDDCFASPGRTGRLSRSNHSGNNINALRWSINSGSSGLHQGTGGGNLNTSTITGNSIMLGKSSTTSGSVVTINGSATGCSFSTASVGAGAGAGAAAASTSAAAASASTGSTSRPNAVRLPPEEKLPTVRTRKTAPTGVGRRTPTFSIIHNKEDSRHPSRGSVSVKEEEKPRSPVHHPMLGAEAEQGRQEGILLPTPQRFLSTRSSVGSDAEDSNPTGSASGRRTSLPGNSNSLNSMSNSNNVTAPGSTTGSLPTPPPTAAVPPAVATTTAVQPEPTPSSSPQLQSVTNDAAGGASSSGSTGSGGGGAHHHHKVKAGSRSKLAAFRVSHVVEEDKKREKRKFSSAQF